MMSEEPFPPAPIEAMFNLSLGAVYPFPNTCLGTIKKPPAARAELLIKFRQVDLFSIFWLNDFNEFKFNKYHDFSSLFFVK